MRSAIRITTAMAAFTLWSGAASADQRLLCVGGPKSGSQFTLDFNNIGSDTSHIAYTEFDLVIDPTSGAARIEYYYQEVDSLTLPGGFETGDLVIAVVPGSSQGAYDAASGSFETSELYAIFFTGDLSAFGLESPVFLPGASSGDVAFDPGGQTGAANLIWDGEGALPDPTNPGGFIPFEYECVVNTEFNAEPPCAQQGCEADVDGDCDVDLDDLSEVLSNFGQVFPGVSARLGDVDANGDVDLTDLSIVLSQLGSDCN